MHKKLQFLLVLLTLVATSALLVSCGGSRPFAQGHVQHIVLCWLKSPGDQSARQRLLEASYGLTSIPGVVDVSAGEAVESSREVVDDSFDVGVVITIESPEQLTDYLQHPTHKAAVAEVLAPLCERILIYDIVQR